MGTSMYTSPEQVSGLNVDTRSDIYSLGVLLRELVTDSARFDQALHAIVMKCLEHDPDRRYQSASDLAKEIERRMHEV